MPQVSHAHADCISLNISNMKSGLNRLVVIVATLVLFASIPEVASAVNNKSSFCKSMLSDVKRIDANGLKLFSKYSKKFALARESGNLEDNLNQTRSLLDLYENDRTLFLRALESKKCFTSTELLNLEYVLANTNANANTTKSWLDAFTGIPGKNFYSNYMELPKYLATPFSWNYCEKKGTKFKSMECKLYEGKLRWIDRSYSGNLDGEISWPTGFIDGKVNLIEAKKRIEEYYDENSVAASTNGKASVDFFKRTSYPGLFDYESEPKLTACRDFETLQDKAGPVKIKYVVNVDGIKPDPDWMLTDDSRGERIVSQKFKGQIFSVPVRIEISKGDWSDPGSFAFRHVAIIDGTVYRFSSC